jgi:hypothetical protein
MVEKKESQSVLGKGPINSILSLFKLKLTFKKDKKKK